MRKTFLMLPLIAAMGLSSSAVFADAATLAAIQQAGVTLTSEQAAKVSAAQGEDIAAVLAEIVSALGNDGATIRTLIEAAVRAAPDHAVAIVSSVSAAVPSAAAIVAGAAIKAAPEQAAAITAAAVSMVPSQAASIIEQAIISSPDQRDAITNAAGSALDTAQPEETSDIGVPSPN
ncbi:MAG: hypothetical protein WC247_11400 [Porticoccaceae bacterium]